MKKRKLNSKNPKYVDRSLLKEEKIKEKKLLCKAKIRNSSGRDTGNTADIHGIWYE